MRRRTAIARLAGWLGAAACLVAAAPAAAETRRYAFLVGSNRGQAHETPLRYAESDVRAVAETLIALGDFPSERVVSLVAPTAERLRAALVDLNLAIQDDARAGHEAVLFVYYSGHGSAAALHLGETALSIEELGKLVRLSPARLKILLVDACRSGALTRVKGGRQVAPFQIGVDDRLRQEGFAVVTSSSAGEDAQESDALRGSIFTHHFLTALRGPADVNRDLQVTLGEAYAYAYEQSLKTSLGTLAGTQHATFEYDLRGRVDPVLSDLRRGAGYGAIVLREPGDYLFMTPDTHAIVVEANAKQADARVLLPAGEFRVRARTRGGVRQGDLSLAAGTTRELAATALDPVPLAQLVRKGEASARLATGPLAGGLGHGPVGDGFSAMWGAQVGWAFDFAGFSLAPRLGFGAGHALALPPDVESHTLRELSAELAALYLFDVGRASLGPLLTLGWSRFSQAIDSRTGCAAPPCRRTFSPNAFVSGLGAWAGYPLPAGFSAEAWVQAANFYLRRLGEADAAPRLGTFTWRAGAGVGYRY